MTLLSKSVQLSPSSNDSNIQLADPGELPQDATLIFAMRAQSPAAFTHEESIEVATNDESSAVLLSFTGNGAVGGLALENSHVAVATLNPSKAFGASAFGPLKFRVTAKGVAGDWQPLASLVRLPKLKELECPQAPELACKSSGSSLYLIDSVSADAQFTDPVQVPDGFLGSALPVPHPTAGTLYVKLRDNPEVVNPITLSAQLPASAAVADRAASRQSIPQAPTPESPTLRSPTSQPAP